MSHKVDPFLLVSLGDPAFLELWTSQETTKFLPTPILIGFCRLSPATTSLHFLPNPILRYSKKLGKGTQLRHSSDKASRSNSRVGKLRIKPLWRVTVVGGGLGWGQLVVDKGNGRSWWSRFPTFWTVSVFLLRGKEAEKRLTLTEALVSSDTGRKTKNMRHGDKQKKWD